MSPEILEPKDNESRNDGPYEAETVSSDEAQGPVAALDEAETSSSQADAAEEALERRLSEPVLKGEHGIEDAQRWIVVFLVVMAGVIAYSNAFTGLFHAEDVRVIQNNTPAHALLDLPRAFVDGAPGALTMASFSLNWSMTPWNATGFHAINVLLHVLNGVLIFFLCRRMLNRETHLVIPMLGALLFTLHPLATESVNYIVGRESLLMMAFTLSSLLLYLRATEIPESPDRVRLGCSLVCAFLAWASGTPGIAATLLILLVERVRADERTGRTPWQYRFAFIVLFVTAMTYEFTTRTHGSEAETISSQILTAGVSLVRSLQLTMLPVGLSIEHGLAVIEPGSERTGIPSVALALVVSVVGCVLWWNRALLGLSILWFMVSGLCAYFFSSTADIYTERHSYMGLAGLAFAVPWAIQYARNYQNGFRTAALVVAGLAMLFGAVSFQRNQLWRDETALWADARDKDPNSHRILKWLAHSEMLLGQQDRSRAETLDSQRQKPAAAAALEEAVSNFRQAEDKLKQVVEEDPNDAEALEDYGYVLRGLGPDRQDDAIAALQNAVRLNPTNQEATFNIAQLWEWKNDTKGRDPSIQSNGTEYYLANAIDYYRRAEKLGPLSDAALVAYGIALGHANKWEEAVSKLSGVVERNPQSPAAPHYRKALNQVKAQEQVMQSLSQLAVEDMEKPESLAKAADLLSLQGKPLQASYLLSSLLEKDPTNLRLWIGLGRARARMRSMALFVKEFPNPPPAEDGGESPWIQLARLCGIEDNWDAAEYYLGSVPAQAQGLGPALLRLADIAESMKMPVLATRFVSAAAQKYPNDPTPWLRMTDKAIADNKLPQAKTLLGEAERRGAPAQEIEPRRAKIGTAPVTEQKEAPKEQQFILR